MPAGFVDQQILPAQRTVHFPHILKRNLLSETIDSQAQLGFICSDSGTATAEQSANYVQSLQ